MKSLLFFFFLISTLMVLGTTTTGSQFDYNSNDTTSSIELEADEITVAFNNRLPQNGNFTIHCNSRDGDLGAHVIAPSSYYEFSFEVNFFQTTYYFCNLRWRDVEAAFYAYRAGRDQARCTHYCLWNVKEEAVEGFREGDGSQPDIVVSWK